MRAVTVGEAPDPVAPPRHTTSIAPSRLMPVPASSSVNPTAMSLPNPDPPWWIPPQLSGISFPSFCGQHPLKGMNTVYLLKMREIYRHLSTTADRGDEAANIIPNIIMNRM